MKIDLAGLATRAGTYRRARFVAREIVPTKAQQNRLLRVYMQVVRAWQRQFMDVIRPRYEATLAEPGFRDSVGDVQGATDEATATLNRLVVALGADLGEWAVEIEQWHRGQFGSIFTPVGVRLDMLLSTGDVGQTLQGVLADNTSLIRSLNDQMRNGISGSVFRGLTNRTPARDVAREIRKQAAIGQARAELIAADQLQKLTSRLDQTRQEQMGLTSFEWAHSGKLHPREYHKARNGLIFKWDSVVGKTDPPGYAIRCGCKARAVLDLDAEAAAIEPTPAPAPAPPPPPPPAPAPAPVVVGGYRSVVNPAVTNESLKVSPRLPLQKALTGELRTAAADERYSTEGKWSKRSASDNGRAVFSADWSDEAVSAVSAVAPELDALADQIGIPRLRGYKTTQGGQNADMGGGVMAISPGEFNARMAAVRGGGGVDELASGLGAQADAIQAEQLALRAPADAIMQRLKELPYGSPEWAGARAERDAISKKWESLQRKRLKLRENSRRAVRQNTKPQTTWAQGDAPKGKPWSVSQYYSEGIDRVRSTMFHEFGHHVHQQYKRSGEGRFALRPLENKLSELWRGPAGKDRAIRQPSEYAQSNQWEWWAENFSLYVMGRKSRVDPVLLELIEDIFNGRF